MKSEDIDALARVKEPLPEDAGLCDMMLYRILRALYAEYAAKTISISIAKVEKARAIEKHREFELWENIYKEHNKRLTELSVIASEGFKNHSCPLCVKMYDILSGYRGRRENEDEKNDT